MMVMPRCILAASLLSATFAAALAAEQPLSDEAQALIVPIFQAYAEVDHLLTLLPAPGDVTEELIRMKSIDQAGRDFYAMIDLTVLPGAERDAAFDAIWNEINRRDLENQNRLKELMPENGWFTISEYGLEGALSAFLIVQHALNDPALQNRALAAMEPLVGSDEIDGRAYALLYDRLAMGSGRYQRYGSQMICQDNRWVLYPLEDSDGVDDRRREANFDLSLSENMARFADRPPCPGDYDGPLPE
jgi:hypothetical protein